MRTVNPDDLEHLARLLDGRGGVKDRIDEAFSRASRLGVSSHLTALKPMRPWVDDTGPDLRKRAAVARLESGDPDAGIKWAGFNAKEIAKAGLMFKAPDVLLLIDAMALSGDHKTDAFRRKSNESLDHWVDRIRAHALASIPGFGPHEEEITELLGDVGDVMGVLSHTGVALYRSHLITKALVGNSVARGWLKPASLWASRELVNLPQRYTWVPSRVGRWGRQLRLWDPAVRSLAYPGSWLPSQLSALGSGSRAYTDANRIPFVSSFIGGQIGTGVDYFRRSQAMASPIVFGVTGNKVIDFLVGSDRLAAMYGGVTHSGAIPKRAAQASLLKITGNVYGEARTLSHGRLASLGEGLKVAGKAGGFLRAAGVFGGVFSTAYSAVNVYKQGDPRAHFDSRERGASYVADCAEFGFNASSTLAMVAPNQYTIGATAVTGVIWSGAKVVEHWDDIKRSAHVTRDWVKEKTPGVVSKIAHGAKILSGTENVFNLL
ncbi:PE-PGRS family protein [Streptomyces sp. NBC_00932]|uniref:PE-PGRS family protein n=1 Tax=Streptomyces sp. NBC_00932 TaxID=2903690 RepID=UPI0038690A87|nr:PE-PGRS family protein [Streptomyces sp. NBC_00932]